MDGKTIYRIEFLEGETTTVLNAPIVFLASRLKFFNGIRVIDAHAAASTLRERVLAPHQTLAGVGYSMGGIVLNRYVSTSKNVALDVSVSISGALCSLYQKDYHRSKRTWQRVITGHMKYMFFRGKWGNRLYQVLGREGYRELLRAQDIVVRFSVANLSPRAEPGG